MKGNIIGRIKEQSKLQDLYDSKMSEFLWFMGGAGRGKHSLLESILMAIFRSIIQHCRRFR